MQPPDVQHVDFEVVGAHGVLRFNRPDTLNALTTDVLRDVQAVLAHVADDDEVRALVITGTGRGFCAGADLKAGRGRPRERSAGTGPRPGPGERMAASMRAHANPVIRDLVALDVPVVAAVNGVAAGAGVGIALACDLVVAARSATFVQVFGPQLGVLPDMGCTWLLPRLVGRARAAGLMLTGEAITAEQAVAWGAIWCCVDDEQLHDEATALARRLAGGPTVAFAALKAALHASPTSTLEAQLDLEAELQGRCVETEDCREGVRAFLEKRPPSFRGR